MADQPRLLVLLALATSEKFDSTSFEILLNGLKHPNSEVRYAAVMGVGVTQWPAFIPELERMTQIEAIQEIQEIVNRALEVCKQRAFLGNSSEADRQDEKS